MDIYLDELAVAIVALIGRDVTERCVWRLLRRLGYTRKRLKRIAHRRSEEERIAYIEQMRAMGYLPEQLVFFDETGTRTRDWRREFGYALRWLALHPIYKRPTTHTTAHCCLNMHIAALTHSCTSLF